jgi:hypothetical protein
VCRLRGRGPRSRGSTPGARSCRLDGAFALDDLDGERHVTTLPPPYETAHNRQYGRVFISEVSDWHVGPPTAEDMTVCYGAWQMTNGVGRGIAFFRSDIPVVRGPTVR